MKNIPQRFLRLFVAATLLLVFLVGSFFALAATVKPVRAELHSLTKSTFMESYVAKHFPLHEEAAHEGASVAQSALPQTQVKEISFHPSAAKNVGINDSTIIKTEVVDYYKSLTFPAVVTDRPGHSVINVPSPVSGVVTKIYHEAGVAVSPGETLFDVLLNQQEMVKAQTEYLSLLKKREINAKEAERLSGLDPSMVPKQRRDLEYEKSQIDLEINVQIKVLQLQGLSDRQINESLEEKREIIQGVTISVPQVSEEDGIVTKSIKTKALFTIDQFRVTIGQNINIGDSLCQLSDLSQLTIRGKVFLADIKRIATALEGKSNVTATFNSNGSREIMNNLKLRSIDNRIDEENGTVYCYVDLENNFQVHESSSSTQKREYVQWHFRPGQRCELNIDYEVISGCIVLPVDAVAQDINEMCVFEWVGNDGDNKIWRKKEVHVLYKTKDVVIIANDGAVFPGTKVTTKGASFLLSALDAMNQKNAGGKGVIDHGDHVH